MATGKKVIMTCPKCGHEGIWWKYCSEVSAGRYDCRARIADHPAELNEIEHHHLGCRRCSFSWAISIDDAFSFPSQDPK